MKKFAAAVLAVVLLLSLAACGGAADTETPAAAPETAAPEKAAEPAPEPAGEPDAAPETETGGDAGPLRLAGMTGPTTMGLANLLKDAGQGGEENTYTLPGYTFRLESEPDPIRTMLLQGDLDAAAVPVNLAAVLYQKTKGTEDAIQVVGVNTLGVLYVLEKGDSIHSVADLKGASILSTGAASLPEYVLRYVLAENGIDPDNDVDLRFVTQPAEAVAQLTAEGLDTPTVVVLPQPQVTAVLGQNEDLRVALDVTEEWGKVAGSRLITGVTVARKAAIEADPARFEAFLADYAASVEAANTDAAGTGVLCEKLGIVGEGQAALAEKALPACNIVFEIGDEMRTDIEGVLQVLLGAAPESIGGALPDDDFYYDAG